MVRCLCSTRILMLLLLLLASYTTNTMSISDKDFKGIVLDSNDETEKNESFIHPLSLSDQNDKKLINNKKKKRRNAAEKEAFGYGYGGGYGGAGGGYGGGYGYGQCPYK